MKVEVEVVGSVEEPYLEVHQRHEIGRLLRPGFMEVGFEAFCGRACLVQSW